MFNIFFGTCAAKKICLTMGGRAEGLSGADPGALTPISMCGNFKNRNNISVTEKTFL